MSRLESIAPGLTVARRELYTMVRTRTFLVAGGAFFVVTIGMVIVADSPSRGYIPTALDLLTPMELLVPIVAFIFGYRAILGDATRGELEVLRTYPLGAPQHVLGVFFGRATGVLTVTVLTLVGVGVLVAVTPAETVRIFATHETADSAVSFVRFVVLTGVLALVFLAIALAISAVATSTRSALALVGAVSLAVVLGLELAIVRGLTGGWLAESQLNTALAFVPTAAYRGLVLETAVGVEAGGATRAASPWLSATGLGLWLFVALAIAVALRSRR